MCSTIDMLFVYFLLNAGISDDTGALADYFTKKYLSKAEMGNFTSMTPGLIDVRNHRFTLLPISS